MPRVLDLLGAEGLIEKPSGDGGEPGDLTQDPLNFPAGRDLRLQNLARGDEGFLLALAYSTQRGYGRTHPFAGEIRLGMVEVSFTPEELGFPVVIGEITVTECEMINQFKGSADVPPQFTRGYGLGFGQCERKAMSMALVDRSLRAGELGEERVAPGTGRGIRALAFRQCAGDRLRRASQAAALRRLPVRARAAPADARRRRQGPAGGGGMNAPAYNFAYLNEQTKRMIRRAILKAIAIPGYQVPFASREMPMPYGWGTGGVQVTAAVLTPDDTLKVIDQGADDTTNAVSIRKFFVKTAGVKTTERTEEATIIQTRHRIPETRLTEDQILVFQVPIPEPLRFLEPRETETRKMHALEEYGVMHVKLYEDIARYGQIATTYAYPAKVADRYVFDPSPIPKFDNPKLDNCPALQLFGAGREKRIYAIPPYTSVKSLDFEDHPFEVQTWDQPCALCGSRDSFLDEIVTDDKGGRMFVCSDTDFCARQRGEA